MDTGRLAARLVVADLQCSVGGVAARMEYLYTVKEAVRHRNCEEGAPWSGRE